MVDVVSQTNQQILGAVTGSISTAKILNVVGWVVFFLLIIGVGVFLYVRWKDNKLYNKTITAFEIVGGVWEPVYRDVARNVKLGSGGFEILYLKNQKTWKIAYGGRVGKNVYYFFIMPDGYWYNGVLNGNLGYFDKTGGLCQVTTTNPLMRGQYTSLEKQIDNLHGEKTNFWDKYGSWVLGIAFVLVAGVMLWLNYKEFANAMGQLGSYNTNMNEMLKQVNNLLSHVTGTSSASNGLVPVGG